MCAHPLVIVKDFSSCDCANLPRPASIDAPSKLVCLRGKEPAVPHRSTRCLVSRPLPRLSVEHICRRSRAETCLGAKLRGQTSGPSSRRRHCMSPNVSYQILCSPHHSLSFPRQLATLRRRKPGVLDTSSAGAHSAGSWVSARSCQIGLLADHQPDPVQVARRPRARCRPQACRAQHARPSLDCRGALLHAGLPRCSPCCNAPADPQSSTRTASARLAAASSRPSSQPPGLRGIGLRTRSSRARAPTCPACVRVCKRVPS